MSTWKGVVEHRRGYFGHRSGVFGHGRSYFSHRRGVFWLNLYGHLQQKARYAIRKRELGGQLGSLYNGCFHPEARYAIGRCGLGSSGPLMIAIFNRRQDTT